MPSVCVMLSGPDTVCSVHVHVCQCRSRHSSNKSWHLQTSATTSILYKSWHLQTSVTIYILYKSWHLQTSATICILHHAIVASVILTGLVCDEGTNKGVSISGTITGTDADSESLRLLRPTILSLAGYFNTTTVSQQAVQLLQVTPTLQQKFSCAGQHWMEM